MLRLLLNLLISNCFTIEIIEKCNDDQFSINSANVVGQGESLTLEMKLFI